MKRLKIVLLSIFVVLVANATEELIQYDKIVLTLVDGTRYEIPINGSSYIYSTIEGSDSDAKQVVLIKGDNCEYKFNREEIKTLECIEYYNSVKSVIDENREQLRYKDDKFKFDPSLEGEELFVYDISGRLVYRETISGESTLTLKGLPTGVYVATVNNVSIKVMVR
jgi:hypothetical protein